MCLLTLAYLAARICKAEVSRVGFKEGVSRAGGQCAEKGRTQSKPGRGSREVHAIL